MSSSVFTKTQNAEWRRLRTADDEQLYALLGGEPSFTLIRKGEALSFRAGYQYTERAIKKGKKKMEEVLDQTRSAICDSWAAFKAAHGTKIKAVEAVTIIYGVLVLTLGAGVHLVAIATAELIWRSCNFNLDVLCGG